MKKDHIKIIKMGGTIEFIDPGYQKINDKLMKLDATVDKYLENLVNPHFSYKVQTICEKDSRDINQDDLNQLGKAVLSTQEEDILITHGTFTMKNTGKFLEKLLQKNKLNKKIILTGAMIPIIGFTVSDAGFNLGYAIASFKAVKPGVYLCMNGGTFTPGEVEKNVELLRFQ